jgi:hypothetical protein
MPTRTINFDHSLFAGQNSMKKWVYLAGIASGIVIAQNWKMLTKEGIKVSVRGGRRLKELTQQAMEDFQDVAAEAVEELGEQEQDG